MKQKQKYKLDPSVNTNVLKSFANIEETQDDVPRQKSRKTQYEVDHFERKDYDIFERTLDEHVLSWEQFTRDFWSTDLQVTDELKALMEANLQQKVDFRPYLIENPVTVFTTDPLAKCVDFFRKMHLRHMIVIERKNGMLAGIITR